MFLSTREILHYKARYILIGSIIFLIAYVVFILSGLATGLSNEFKQGVVDWKAEKVILSDSSNDLLNGSQIATSDVDKIKGGETSPISLFTTSVDKSKDNRINITIFAMPDDSVIKPELKNGQMFDENKSDEVVISQGLADEGFKIGQKIKVGNHKTELKVVGISKASDYSATPLVYTSFKTLTSVQNGTSSEQIPFVNAVVVKSGEATYKDVKAGQLKTISINELIDNIPGYTAQQTTLDAMIYFMFLIVLMIVGVFMYVITLQKVPIFGIMKAQGISNFVIVKSLLWQGFWVGLVGVALAFLASYGTSFILPAAMPFGLSIPTWILYSAILVVVSVLGSVFSIFTVRKVDPTKAIGA
ncbi:ABC transporter permease [Lactococcus fujiensis]|uniref:Putative hemin transport system permease protein HrtB n=1 Tax=Lactococcus fujiensis JCM 16395 TaxID=1291764 RepID=A0A2A5RKP4_9LACT|nr:ABC transporter permease [Lactococcus fujiensis]PCR99771.1 ABC transporter permease [Lactococcus fujiensis JCM 16395]